MKIENYIGTADTFTWPYNPKVYDDATDPNYQITQIGFQKHHILISGDGINTKKLVINGHFSGTNKLTSWRSCSKHFLQTTLLKKFFFESDKFYLGVGKQIKKTHSAGRTNFIDYVGTFEAIVGVLFGDTEKVSGTNDGNVRTFITEITGTYDGSGDIIITDDLGNEITIDSAHLTINHPFTYKLVQMVDSGNGIFVSEYGYVELNSVQSKNVQTTGGFGILQLEAGANMSTIVTQNLNTVVTKFRDGYYD